MKKSGLILVFGSVLFAGWLIGWLTTPPKGSDVHPEAAWEPRDSKEGTVSPLFFERYYFKAKHSIEVRFDHRVAFIDGEVFSGENLDATILKKKDGAKARFLVLVGEDHEPFGPVVERVSHFRSLGFEAVVLMCTKE